MDNRSREKEIRKRNKQEGVKRDWSIAREKLCRNKESLRNHVRNGRTTEKLGRKEESLWNHVWNGKAIEILERKKEALRNHVRKSKETKKLGRKKVLEIM